MSEDVFAPARPIANAVLYEGYVLYPYRASSKKNQSRWQFGVLMPPAYASTDNGERSANRTEFVLEPRTATTVQIELCFLHAQHRSGGEQPDWDEAIERRISFTVELSSMRSAPHQHPFAFAAADSADGGVRRETAAVSGALIVDLVELPGPYGAVRLGVTIENRSASEADERDGALRSALIAAHTLYAVDAGRFVSMTDPPEWARPFVTSCTNVGTWPVLIGGDALMLSSPIILDDNPQIAPESPGELYDATEIDEILTLRTMALTDAEKAEARATDPRAAAVIDQVDGLPQEQLDRLHGALRYLRNVTGEKPTPAEDELPTWLTPDAPWWDPGADASVSPGTDAVVIDGVRVARGSRVRLRPGRRRTDAQDLFLAGRVATVEAVLFDVDGASHLGVVVDDDAELADLARWHGRFLYFAPDEVEPMSEVTR